MQYDKELHNQVVDFVKKTTFFDNYFMALAFDNNIQAVQRMVRILLNRDDITVISVKTEHSFSGATVRNKGVRLDIIAEDSKGNRIGIELQKDIVKANPRRARFYSAQMDVHMLKKSKQDNYHELKESYVILITQKDYFKDSKPVHHFERFDIKTGTKLEDGSHIVYVDSSYRNNDALGKLMSDLHQTEAKDMYYSELSETMDHFKQTLKGEGAIMTEAEKVLQEILKTQRKKDNEKLKKQIEKEVEKSKYISTLQSTIRSGVEFGATKAQVLNSLVKNLGISEEKAKREYTRCMKTLNL